MHCFKFAAILCSSTISLRIKCTAWKFTTIINTIANIIFIKFVVWKKRRPKNNNFRVVIMYDSNICSGCIKSVRQRKPIGRSEWVCGSETPAWKKKWTLKIVYERLDEWICVKRRGPIWSRALAICISTAHMSKNTQVNILSTTTATTPLLLLFFFLCFFLYHLYVLDRLTILYPTIICTATRRGAHTPKQWRDESNSCNLK